MVRSGWRCVVRHSTPVTGPSPAKWDSPDGIGIGVLVRPQAPAFASGAHTVPGDCGKRQARLASALEVPLYGPLVDCGAFSSFRDGIACGWLTRSNVNSLCE
jgi:hypothetical protein